jgi:hypothetical protein
MGSKVREEDRLGVAWGCGRRRRRSAAEELLERLEEAADQGPVLLA